MTPPITTTTPLPEEVRKAESQYKAMRLQLKTWQASQLAATGRYKKISQPSGVYNIKAGISLVTEYYGGKAGKGFVIDIHVVTSLATKVTVNAGGRKKVTFTTNRWVKREDFVNTKYSYDWTPVMPEPPEIQNILR